MLVILLLLLAVPGLAEGRIYPISVGAYVGGIVMDGASSYGGQEINPLLRSSDGRFGNRGVVIMSGLAVGGLVAQVQLQCAPSRSSLFPC